MRPPENSVRLPFPVDMKPYLLAGFRATRAELRELLGEPHYVETDELRTPGGEQDNWGWEVPSGQKVLIYLHVPYDRAYIVSDPADINSVIIDFQIDTERWQLDILPKPNLLK